MCNVTKTSKLSGVRHVNATLLGIEIDNKLNFEKQVANICQKANNQLNAIGRIQDFLGKKEKETIIVPFILILCIVH